MDILEQIRANYGSFSRPRQRISDFILNYPEQCCFLSLRSFAQQVGTTEVTVLNFCRGLGLGSYMDLKKALQDYFDRNGIPYDEKDFPACEHCAHCESV